MKLETPEPPRLLESILLDLQGARERGFLGKAPMEFQVSHALEFADCCEHVLGGMPARWLDLGTGGGLPGLLIAYAWSDSRAVLVDSNERKVAYLRSVVAALGWDGRVETTLGRAEDLGRSPELRGRFPLVVAPAFGPPPVTAECAAPLASVGGYVVVSEPPGGGGEVPPRGASMGAGGPAGSLSGEPGRGAFVREPSDPRRWPRAALQQVGLEPEFLLRRNFGYQVLRQVTECPARYPRRSVVPSNLPLYLVDQR